MYLRHMLTIEPRKVKFGPHVFLENMTYGIVLSILRSKEATDFRREMRAKYSRDPEFAGRMKKDTFLNYCYLGNSPKEVETLLRKAMFKAFVLPYPKELRSLVFKSNDVCDFYRRTLERHPSRLDVAKQAILDGNTHVTPFIIATGLDPNQLKTGFGKGLWKRLCKNSFHRNMLVASCIRVSAGSLGQVGGMSPWIKAANEVPSVLLSRLPREVAINLVRFGVPNFQSEIAAVLLRYTCKSVEFRFKKGLTKLAKMSCQIDAAVMLYLDIALGIRQDANEAELARLAKLTTDELYQVHRAQIRAKLDKKDPVRRFNTALFPADFRTGNISVTFIKSTAELKTEGQVMHHCVSGYAPRCINGSYVVASLVSDDGTRSTLGVNLTAKGPSFSQHKVHCNDLPHPTHSVAVGAVFAAFAKMYPRKSAIIDDPHTKEIQRIMFVPEAARVPEEGLTMSQLGLSSWTARQKALGATTT